MTSVFEKYFEDETFETDVFLIRSETYDYGDDPVEVYRNPDNPEDVGCYSQFDKAFYGKAGTTLPAFVAYLKEHDALPDTLN